MAALPVAHDYLIGASRTAAEILRQQMVLNALHGAGEQWAAEAGNAAALRAYTEARAEAQTVSAYRAIGRQAETWVPMLRIVFECLYVGAFPMAVLLMLTPAGGGIFRSYFAGIVWIQSWGPLYAILHRISMGEAAERMSAGALMPGGESGVSLVAQAGIRAVASDVAVMSGYLSMSVPFLAAALAYGVGKATMLATSVLAVGQDAASSAAHEGTTGNISLANTQADVHRFATLEGRQLRTSMHVDTDRYTGFAPEGAAFTVTGDGTAVMDAGSATSRIPAAGVRLSESLAVSHESRAGAAREQARHWSAEAGTARTAVATDSAAMVERFSRDAHTGLAHSRGVTESESTQVQALESHMERLSEAGGISKEEAAVLTGEAKVGGGFDFIVKFGADGSASWRGQTFEREAWNRMTDYAEQNQVLDLWSRVADASRRYSASSGESELKSLEESFGANLTRMRRFGEQEALSHREAESWSEQAAEVRSRSRAVDQELGQPFFAWLTARPGADGREIGVAGAMRLASPQTPEDAEELRAHAAAFIAERFPTPEGPDPASVPGLADYERRRDGLKEYHAGETEAAWGGWSDAVRDRGRGGRDARAGQGRDECKARARRDRDRSEGPGGGTRGADQGREGRHGARTRGRTGRARQTFSGARREGGAVHRRVARGQALRHGQKRGAGPGEEERPQDATVPSTGTRCSGHDREGDRGRGDVGPRRRGARRSGRSGSTSRTGRRPLPGARSGRRPTSPHGGIPATGRTRGRRGRSRSLPRTRCPPGSGHRSRWPRKRRWRRGRWRARRGRRPGRASRWMGRMDWTRVVPPGLRFKASRAPASPVPASRALDPAFLGLPPGASQHNGAKTAAIHTTLNGRTR